MRSARCCDKDIYLDLPREGSEESCYSPREGSEGCTLNLSQDFSSDYINSPRCDHYVSPSRNNIDLKDVDSNFEEEPIFEIPKYNPYPRSARAATLYLTTGVISEINTFSAIEVLEAGILAETLFVGDEC